MTPEHLEQQHVEEAEEETPEHQHQASAPSNEEEEDASSSVAADETGDKGSFLALSPVANDEQLPAAEEDPLSAPDSANLQETGKAPPEQKQSPAATENSVQTAYAAEDVESPPTSPPVGRRSDNVDESQEGTSADHVLQQQDTPSPLDTTEQQPGQNHSAPDDDDDDDDVKAPQTEAPHGVDELPQHAEGPTEAAGEHDDEEAQRQTPLAVERLAAWMVGRNCVNVRALTRLASTESNKFAWTTTTSSSKDGVSISSGDHSGDYDFAFSKASSARLEAYYHLFRAGAAAYETLHATTTRWRIRGSCWPRRCSVTVNLTDMTATTNDQTGVTVPIERKRFTAAIAYPKWQTIGLQDIRMGWKDGVGTTSGIDNALYEEVSLSFFSWEYQQVAKYFRKTSMQFYNIHSIRRIQNSILWIRYCQGRDRVASSPLNKGQPNEEYLWHGTPALEQILTGGFDTARNKSHPKGIWLSTFSHYSVGYCDMRDDRGRRKMILVRTSLGHIGEIYNYDSLQTIDGVLVDSHHCGKTSIGHMRRDDQTKWFDGGVDNRYVIPHNDQVYPAYVVEFSDSPVANFILQAIRVVSLIICIGPFVVPIVLAIFFPAKFLLQILAWISDDERCPGLHSWCVDCIDNLCYWASENPVANFMLQAVQWVTRVTFLVPLLLAYFPSKFLLQVLAWIADDGRCPCLRTWCVNCICSMENWAGDSLEQLEAIFGI